MASNEDEQAIVRCDTSKGSFSMKFKRNWSPLGYDRAVELFERGFYDHSHFFRVIPGFLAQFGISYTTDEDLKAFAKSTIMDEPQLDPPIPFLEGTIAFAGSGDNTRSSHLFVSYGPSKSLGTLSWETPIGEVIEGMETVKNLYPVKNGPAQGKVHNGPQYIENNFPETDKFEECHVERIPATLSGGKLQQQSNYVDPAQAVVASAGADAPLTSKQEVQPDEEEQNLEEIAEKHEERAEEHHEEVIEEKEEQHRDVEHNDIEEKDLEDLEDVKKMVNELELEQNEEMNEGEQHQQRWKQTPPKVATIMMKEFVETAKSQHQEQLPKQQKDRFQPLRKGAKHSKLETQKRGLETFHHYQHHHHPTAVLGAAQSSTFLVLSILLVLLSFGGWRWKHQGVKAFKSN